MAVWTVSEPKRLDLDESISRVDVKLTSARLTIVGSDEPSRIEISKMAAAPIHIKAVGGQLTIEHEKPNAWPGWLAPLWWMLNGARFHADVSIAVPYETLANVSVASGSVTVSSLRSDVVAECVSGRVTLFGIVGSLRAKVVSGPIEVLGCAGPVRVETVSGEITLADTASGQVTAKTVSGALTADLDNPPKGCDIRLDTISGEITVRIREDSDLAVKLNAAHGRVTSEFPQLGHRGAWGASTSGTIGQPGSGSGRLAVNAVGGNVVLLRRPADADFGVAVTDPDVGVDFDAGDREAR